MDGRNRQPTSVRLDYRATDRQTQPNAVWFGREERFEHAFSVLGIDPRPGILDTDKRPNPRDARNAHRAREDDL